MLCFNTGLTMYKSNVKSRGGENMDAFFSFFLAASSTPPTGYKIILQNYFLMENIRNVNWCIYYKYI
jgi:hypothetical protein